MAKRYGKEVTGVCSICKSEGYTEMHHIISRSKIEKIQKPDLLKNPDNLIELCKDCHDLTDSSSYRLWYLRKNPNSRRRRTREEVRLHRERKRERKGLFQCAGRLKRGKGRRCEVGVSKEGEFCRTHEYQRPHSPSKD